MRLVIDTNILISALFFGGLPKKLLDDVCNKKFDVFVNYSILDEYYSTAFYIQEKINKKLNIDNLNYFVSNTYFVDQKNNLKLCRDPNDDMFINCALDSNSSYLISGDYDLLSLKQIKNTKIVKIKDFYQKYFS